MATVPHNPDQIGGNDTNALKQLNLGLLEKTSRLIADKLARHQKQPQINIEDYAISKSLSEIVAVLSAAGIQAHNLEFSDVPENLKGDFAITVPSLLASNPGTNLKDLATRIVEEISKRKLQYITSAQVCGIYVNVELDFTLFAQETLQEVQEFGDRYGNTDRQYGKKVLIDYSSPNTAKEMHVAHLRSTVIGESIARILDRCGAITFRINHLGDWGTQFGKLIVAYEEAQKDTTRNLKAEIDSDPIGTLARLYVQFNKELVVQNPALEKEAKERFSRLEKGDAEMLSLWLQFSEWSAVEFNEMYERLNISFDAFLGESFYEEEMGRTVDDALKAGIAYEAGANVIVPFREITYEVLSPKGKKQQVNDIAIDISVAGNEDKQRLLVELNALKTRKETLHKIENSEEIAHIDQEIAVISGKIQVSGEEKQAAEQELKKLESEGGDENRIDALRALLSTGEYRTFLLRKDDGSSLYQTRDIAALRKRKEMFGTDQIIYVVGGEQSGHFVKCFKIAKLLGYIDGDEPVHTAFGLLTTDGAKMSSRKGGTYRLTDLLDEAHLEAEKMMTGRDDVHKADDAEIVSQGAIIFNDLGKDRTTNIDFDLKRMLSISEASGAYLQYATVRCKSILEKNGHSKNLPIDPELIEQIDISERKLIRLISLLPNILSRSSDILKPHILGTYLITLAQAFNTFYAKVHIGNSEERLRDFRLNLTEVTLQTLKNGLDALCIKIPSKM